MLRIITFLSCICFSSFAFSNNHDKINIQEQKSVNGYDFIIAEFSNSPSKQCQADAYEKLNSIFDTHSGYLCSKSFTHVEVEIAKGNYQQALDYLDSGEMIPPCHLLYKTEILALIDLAVNTQLADQQLKASLQKQVKGPL